MFASSRVASRRTFVAACALVLLAGCVDTELSVEVIVTGGTLVVSADGDVEARLAVDVRVGRYALSGDDVTLSRASFFVGETPAADFVLRRPDGFGRVEPGERVSVEVSGSATAAAFPNARDVLCGAPEATALVTWTAREQPDDPLDPPLMSLGSAEGVVDVRCD